MQTRDLGDSDVLPWTQAAASVQLGVRRTTVTLMAKELQQSGLITCRRGKVTINDLDGLRAEACSCYEYVRALTV